MRVDRGGSEEGGREGRGKRVDRGGRERGSEERGWI